MLLRFLPCRLTALSRNLPYPALSAGRADGFCTSIPTQSSQQHNDRHQQNDHHDQPTSSQPADATKKLHVLKCTKAVPSPVSQAVAFMLGRDLIPQEQLRSNMDMLSQQMVQHAVSHSSTEMSAFVEACRKIGYEDSAAFKAMLQHLAPNAASIAADELPSLLWAASRLAVHTAEHSSTDSQEVSSTDTKSSSSRDSGTDASNSTGSSSSIAVPQNDGVVGAVDSSRLAGLPEVLEFLLGASQVLSGDLDDVDSQELPVLAAALADLEYRDPFLLTVLAESVMERKSELSEAELSSLIINFAGMGRWFFDNRLLDQLTVEVVQRATAGTVSSSTVQAVAQALASINHKNKVLQQYLDKLE